mgnify:CR=1 FL=1|jgi:hypothetical protein
MSLRDTYPAVLIRILGKALSDGEDEFGSIICFSRELKAACTESGEVMSHS